MKRFIQAVLGVALLAGTAGACAYATPGTSEIGCVYKNGPLDGRAFDKTIWASKGRTGIGLNDTTVYLPITERNYVVDRDPSTGDAQGVDVFSVPSAGNIPVEVEVQARLAFNQTSLADNEDKALACDWWERHGKRYPDINFDDPTKDKGWAEFLKLNVRQPLFTAVRDAISASGASWDNLYVNATVDGKRLYDTIADQAAKQFAEDLHTALGQNYFCGPGSSRTSCQPIIVTIKTITPADQNLLKQNQAILAAENQRKVDNANAEVTRNKQEQDAKTEQARLAAQKATEEARKATEEAKRAADEIKARADAAYCIELAKAGVDCALLEAAKNKNYPQVIGGSAAPVVQVPNGSGS